VEGPQALEASPRSLADVLGEVAVSDDLLLKLGRILCLEEPHRTQAEGCEGKRPLIGRREFLEGFDIHGSIVSVECVQR
jgi:hypothetical protein